MLNKLSDKRLVKSCFRFVGGLYFQLSVNRMISRAIGIKQTRVNQAKIKKYDISVVIVECLPFPNCVRINLISFYTK